MAIGGEGSAICHLSGSVRPEQKKTPSWRKRSLFNGAVWRWPGRSDHHRQHYPSNGLTNGPKLAFVGRTRGVAVGGGVGGVPVITGVGVGVPRERVEVGVGPTDVAVGVGVGPSGVAVAVGVTPPSWMVKLALEMSKKMLVAHFTRTRAWLVDMLGAVTVWLPSFGVLVARVMG